MKFGPIQIDILDTGAFHADAGAAFGLIPKVIWQKTFTPDELNRIRLALNCLLIRTPQHTIVVDTGVGDKLNEKSRKNFGYEGSDNVLVDALKAHGVSPDQVDFVVNSHLHFDHCGGNTFVREGHVVATFPYARYLVQEREWKDAQTPNERTRATYLKENYVPLQETKQVELITGPLRLTPEVEIVPTPGHTAGHQSVLFVAGGIPFFFTADMVQYTVHLEKLAWCSAFDHEPMVNIETKRWVLDKAEHEGWVVIFQHDPLRTFTKFDAAERIFKPWSPPLPTA